jgi:hypothetical protein
MGRAVNRKRRSQARRKRLIGMLGRLERFNPLHIYAIGIWNQLSSKKTMYNASYLIDTDVASSYLNRQSGLPSIPILKLH